MPLSNHDKLALREDVLDLSRQSRIGPLSPWFDRELIQAIEWDQILPRKRIEWEILPDLTRKLEEYRTGAGVDTVVLGMSGGVDSALTAALFKRAGWRVIGHTLPIHQDPAETRRGIEACAALGIAHVQVDLSDQYDAMAGTLGRVDADLRTPEALPVRIRLGNIRARLRMMALYDQAARHGGLVGSTDNFSELAAGFWTLHGDVGDVCPIQAMTKSWEVPALARAVGVPEETWRATPTDGLGISDGDEVQLGASYLEWDLMLMALRQLEALDLDDFASGTGMDGDARARIRPGRRRGPPAPHLVQAVGPADPAPPRLRPLCRHGGHRQALGATRHRKRPVAQFRGHPGAFRLLSDRRRTGRRAGCAPAIRLVRSVEFGA